MPRKGSSAWEHRCSQIALTELLPRPGSMEPRSRSDPLLKSPHCHLPLLPLPLQQPSDQCLLTSRCPGSQTLSSDGTQSVLLLLFPFLHRVTAKKHIPARYCAFSLFIFLVPPGRGDEILWQHKEKQTLRIVKQGPRGLQPDPKLQGELCLCDLNRST